MPYSSNKLTRKQKEAVSLLSIGTILEYFDLMLYVHMAVLLNELFFPQNNLMTAKLLSVSTLCLTFILRPVGGFLIGWIGDQIGRKSTIILTTSVMSISCVVMANLGTYAEIGITATIIVIVCRMLQGFSSMGEIIGATLYLAETLRAPHRYVCNGIVEMSHSIGPLFALALASFTLSMNLNWRIAFWVGAVIAVIGIFARTRLRETPEFINFKTRMKMKTEISKQDNVILQNHTIHNEKVDKKAVLAYFLIIFAGFPSFYVTYMYMGNFMKESLGMTATEVINQNFRVQILIIIGTLIAIFLVRKHHPIKIAKYSVAIFCAFLPFIPWWINNISGLLSLSCLQFMVYSFELSIFALVTICYKTIHIAKRFSVIAITYGVSGALSLPVTSFSLIPLTQYFGHYALWIIFVPVMTGFIYGMRYIEKLEKKSGRYFNYPSDNNSDYPDTTLYTTCEEYDFAEKEKYLAYDVNCKYSQDLLKILSEQAKIQNRKINTALIEKAIIFAKKWHNSCFRDSGEPFYSHPLAVASIIAEYYCKTDVIIGAILHDVIEDSDCTVALIAKEFNQRVAEIVYKLTKIKVIDGKVIKLKLEEIIEELKQDPEDLLIKQVDRIHNLHTIGSKPKEKQIKSAIESNNYLMPSSAYTADMLNIPNKFIMEDIIFEYCRDILMKYRRKF